jgi:hypothetical protein
MSKWISDGLVIESARVLELHEMVWCKQNYLKNGCISSSLGDGTQVTVRPAEDKYNRLERGARRLVTEVWHLVDQGIISARSAAGDAALDLRDDIDPNWMPTRYVLGMDRNSAIGRFPSEREEAKHIIQGYIDGLPIFDGWHYIDNANNDLLREIIKQLVAIIKEMINE